MTRRLRVGLGMVMVIALVGGLLVVLQPSGVQRTNVVGYFANSTGIFVGDEVRILGIPVGKVDNIEPDGTRVKITFWYDDIHQVPADAKAVILSPTVVPARAIQLTPAYTGGPAMADHAVIPLERTVVPVEWDEFREQLQNLTTMLEPSDPDGVSTLGSVVTTAADNLRGQGADIRSTLVQLSQALSALGDHSDDIFSTVKNLSVLVSALRNSTDVIRRLNVNLAEATRLLSNDPWEIGNALKDISAVVGDVQSFVAANRETLGTTSDQLSSVSTTVVESLDDLKQTLHIAPNTLQNVVNIYHPAQAALSSAAVINNFSNPITMLCGAIQAASRLNAEQSAKLCVQYLAPIVKNRQMNFPPLGLNPIVGAQARPNELTYSEDWLRPDYVPPQQVSVAPSIEGAELPVGEPLPAEAQGMPDPRQLDPGAGLREIMTPPGAGS